MSLNTQPQPAFIETEAAMVIDLSQIWHALRRNILWIAFVTVAFLGVSAVVAFCCMQEKYRSEATIVFNRTQPPSVVSNVETLSQFFQTQGIEVSPFKNQEELLKSHAIARRLYEDNDLKAAGIRISAGWPDEIIQKILTVSHVRNTDFIRLGAVYNNPRQAQAIAKAYLKHYRDLMNEIAFEPLAQQKRLFEEQSALANRELNSLNNRIQAYQETHGIVDINRESQDKVIQLSGLSNLSKTYEASLAEKRAEVLQIRHQLRLNGQDITTAIQAVAGGQDSLLSTLQQDLNDAEKEYSVKALTYSSSNPDMEQLQKKIATLKKQIIDRQVVSVGLSAPAKAIIKDEVRTDLVSRLASREAEYAALQNKLGTVRAQFTSLQREMKQFPEHQIEYANMLLEKKHREDIQTKLREKLAEIQIQESAAHKDLIVVDYPNLPAKPLFPTRWHIIALGGLLGFVLSSGLVVGRTLMQPPTVCLELVEKGLQLPVLSVIPWLPQDFWQKHRGRNTLEVLSSSAHLPTLKAYQDLALNLKAQCTLKEKKVLVVSSLLQEAKRSVILPNLAFCLAQSGERVLMIDASLQRPRLHNVFGHPLDYDRGLPEVINSISGIVYRMENANASELLSAAELAVLPSGLHPKLFYINAGVALENTFEFLNSSGFATLIQTLKTNYDWILLDAPPFLKVPDASVLLGYSDGLLLLVERDAEEAHIRAVSKRVARLNSTLLGLVLREPHRG